MNIQIPAMTIDLRRLVPALLLIPLALAATTPHAQKGASKVAVVNVDSVLQKVSGGQAVADLRKRANTDLDAQTKKIQALQAKTSPTAADRQALDTAMKTFNAAQQNYAKQIAAQFQPVAGRVNAAVAAAAKAGGFAVVFDAGVAQRSGLIIYADNNATNLTAAVIKQLK